MSGNDDASDLFASRPDTVHIDGIGDVPVQYVESDQQPLPSVAPADVYVHSPEIAWSDLGDELVIYQQRLATSHILDNVSALLWQCIDGVGTLHEIFTDLANAFAQPLDAIVSDLATVVAEWKRDALIVAVGEAPVAPDTAHEVVPSWRHLVDPPNN